MSHLFEIEDYLRITNCSEEPIQGRYDGRDYLWEPGEHLDVHKDVARHIFGFVTPDMGFDAKRVQDLRERAFMRLGWMGRSDQTLKMALEKLRQTVVIEPMPIAQNVKVIRKDNPHLAPSIEVTETSAAGGSGAGVGDGGSTAVPEVSRRMKK
jgi:hypothetical protein